MKHYDRDTFTYDTIGENAVGQAASLLRSALTAKLHRLS